MTSPTSVELEARVEELERRMKRSDPRASMETAFWAVMHNVLPEETRRHMKAATREQLLAARSYLDHWIERMDEKTPVAAAPTRETIEVE
jgi:hypothetical protein